MKKFIAVLLAIFIITIAYFFFPIAIFLVKVLVGLGIIVIFGLGIWVGTLFNNKK